MDLGLLEDDDRPPGDVRALDDHRQDVAHAKADVGQLDGRRPGARADQNLVLLTMRAEGLDFEAAAVAPSPHGDIQESYPVRSETVLERANDGLMPLVGFDGQKEAQGVAGILRLRERVRDLEAFPERPAELDVERLRDVVGCSFFRRCWPRRGL